MDILDEITVTERDEADSSFPATSEFAKRSRHKTTLEHRVHHGLFKWVIEKYSDFPPIEDKHCISPIFILKETSWLIALHPRAKSFGVKKIAINLIRNSLDTGPKSVSVSYRMGLENAGNKVWFKAVESRNFGKGDSYGFETSILGHLEDFIAEGVKHKDDTVSVLCEMYVLYVDKVKKVASNDNGTEVDMNLSCDLLYILKKQQHADVLIEIPRYRLRAHKSVLCARSKTLARLLEDGKSFLQFNCTRSCLQCAVYYMYSGSFKFLATNAVFSIGLYEFACELSLTKLIDILVPQNVELKSRILVDRYKLECTLPRFKLPEKPRDSSETRVYLDEGTDACVSFYFRKLGDSPNYVECCLGLSGLAEVLHFDFRLFLVNSVSDPCKVIPARFLRDSGEEFRNSVFLLKAAFRVDDILRCSSNGKLCLIFTCACYFLRHSPQIPANVIGRELQRPSYDPEDWLEELSWDMNLILQSGKLSDIKLSSVGMVFPVHRSILAARSGYFRRSIHYSGSKNEVKKISNVVPFTLELLLVYMYAGTLGDTEDLCNEDFLELYEVAEYYEVKSLIEACQEFLSIFLDSEFVYDVMIVAKKYNNEYLMSLCTNYIASLGVSSTESDESNKDERNNTKSEKEPV